MTRKRFTENEILATLTSAQEAVNSGQTVREVCRNLGIAEQTYYRWRKEHMEEDNWQRRRIRELEKENERLRQLVAEQALNNSILRESNKR